MLFLSKQWSLKVKGIDSPLRFIRHSLKHHQDQLRQNFLAFGIGLKNQMILSINRLCKNIYNVKLQEKVSFLSDQKYQWPLYFDLQNLLIPTYKLKQCETADGGKLQTQSQRNAKSPELSLSYSCYHGSRPTSPRWPNKRSWKALNMFLNCIFVINAHKNLLIHFKTIVYN